MSKILLIVTGSISAYKSISIANTLRKNGNEVKVVLTKSALNFAPKIVFSSQGHPTFVDEDEWVNVTNVLHIELTQWCDEILVAPMSANTLAKFSNGISDNLATCCLLALPKDKRIVLCPAMNTHMLENNLTKRNLKNLLEINDKIEIVESVVKTLACGVTGNGALASIEEICKNFKKK